MKNIKVGDLLRTIATDCSPHCKKGKVYTVVKVTNFPDADSHVTFERCDYEKSCYCLNGHWTTYDTSFELVGSEEPITPEEMAKAVSLCKPEEVAKALLRGDIR